jgi:hypothetical protein
MVESSAKYGMKPSSVPAAECSKKAHHSLARIRGRTLREARHHDSKEQNDKTGQPFHEQSVLNLRCHLLVKTTTRVFMDLVSSRSFSG